MFLQSRQSYYGPDYYGDRTCYNNGVYYRCRNSAWDNWVRWVVLVVVVLGFLLLFVLCSCLTARRRRKAGRQPFYGTGWAARPGQYTNSTQSAAPYYGNHPPAPPYSAATDNHSNAGYYNGGGANQNYYGQQNGVELQSPQPTYGGGYAPPPGPPPMKG